MKIRSISILLLLSILLVTPGCFGPTAEEKLRAELLALSKEECFEKGKAFIADKSWEKGRKYLTYVYENYPSDPISREALLRLSDSYFEEGSDTAYIEALYRYRDYQSRYPNRTESDYVLMRIGDCMLNQSGDPDRDQSNTKKALQQFQELLRLYPQTLRRDEIVAKIRKSRDLLGQHELAVGRFYVRRGFTDSAVGRLTGLLQDFPDFGDTDEVLYWLVRACNDLGKVEQARFFRHRLETEFSASPWTSRAPDLPRESVVEPPPAPANGA